MTMLKPNHSHVLLTLGTLFAFGGASRFLPDNIATADEVSQEQPTATHKDTISSDQLVAQDLDLQSRNPATATPQDGSECIAADIAKGLNEDIWLFEAEQAAIREKELSLASWEADLLAQTSELRALHDALQERWEEMQTGAEGDLEHLAQMYGAMKADQAAQIFNQMDPDFAAGFLFQLSSEQAGLILANMDQEKAYIISVSMASINSDLRETSRAKSEFSLDTSSG